MRTAVNTPFNSFIRWIVERVQGAMGRVLLDPGSENIADDEEWNYA
jgi:hypothetical protein